MKMDINIQAAWIGVWGTIIGTIIGALISGVVGHLQEKKAIKQKKTELTNNIVAETLKFIFKMTDILQQLQTERLLIAKLKSENSQNVKEHEAVMHKNFYDNINKDFFNLLSFHSFQLKRLENQTIWKSFEALVEKYNEVMELNFNKKPKAECEKIENEFSEMKKEFIGKCISITKI